MRSATSRRICGRCSRACWTSDRKWNVSDTTVRRADRTRDDALTGPRRFGETSCAPRMTRWTILSPLKAKPDWNYGLSRPVARARNTPSTRPAAGLHQLRLMRHPLRRTERGPQFGEREGWPHRKLRRRRARKVRRPGLSLQATSATPFLAGQESAIQGSIRILPRKDRRKDSSASVSQGGRKILARYQYSRAVRSSAD
jgi:hypothetical protein